ncbi:hypothetical protein AMTRI_Chr13g116060 [Amborella trichopoda]
MGTSPKRLDFSPQRLVSDMASPTPSQEKNQNNGKYPHFLLKGLFIAVAVAFVPFLSSLSSSQFSDQSSLTRSWELLHLVLIGLAISYGLLSRKHSVLERETETQQITTQNYVAKLLQVSPVFDEEIESFHCSDNGKVSTWNSQYFPGESLVMVADKDQGFSDETRPLLLPVRSLRSSLSDPKTVDLDDGGAHFPGSDCVGFEGGCKNGDVGTFSRVSSGGESCIDGEVGSGSRVFRWEDGELGSRSRRFSCDNSELRSGSRVFSRADGEFGSKPRRFSSDINELGSGSRVSNGGDKVKNGETGSDSRAFGELGPPYRVSSGGDKVKNGETGSGSWVFNGNGEMSSGSRVSGVGENAKNGDSSSSCKVQSSVEKSKRGDLRHCDMDSGFRVSSNGDKMKDTDLNSGFRVSSSPRGDKIRNGQLGSGHKAPKNSDRVKSGPSYGVSKSFDPLILRERLEETVLPSPVPWRSRSGRLEITPASIEPELQSFDDQPFRSPIPWSSRPSSSSSPSPKNLSPSPSVSLDFGSKNTETEVKKKPPTPPPMPPSLATFKSQASPKPSLPNNSPPSASDLSKSPKEAQKSKKQSFDSVNRDFETEPNRAESPHAGKSVRTRRLGKNEALMEERSVRKAGKFETEFTEEARRFGETEYVMVEKPGKKWDQVGVSGGSKPPPPPLESDIEEEEFNYYENRKREKAKEKAKEIEDDGFESPGNVSVRKREKAKEREQEGLRGYSSGGILKVNAREEIERVTVETDESDGEDVSKHVEPDSNEVDKKADEFIAKFREQIRLQRIQSIKRSSGQQSKNQR